jgi:hypothetical protein
MTFAIWFDTFANGSEIVYKQILHSNLVFIQRSNSLRAVRTPSPSITCCDRGLRTYIFSPGNPLLDGGNAR